MGKSNPSSSREMIPETKDKHKELVVHPARLTIAKRTSNSRSTHDLLAAPASNQREREMNLTQGGEISQDSDKEDEIRPSKILPKNFNINALGV